MNARDGFTLWSDAFEGDGGNVFALQDAIASASVEALRAHYGIDSAAARP